MTSATGAIDKLDLATEGFGEPQAASVIDGSLSFFTSQTVDPKNPAATLAATVKVPPTVTSMIVLVVPGPKDAKPPYRMLVLDDSLKAFPKGESRVVNLTPVEFAMEVGEHKLKIIPGQITPVPKITKVDEFNQAQTNFYFKQGTSWAVFAERQMQYIDRLRRVFLIYTTPGAVQPDIRTLVDTLPTIAPK